MKVGNRKKFTCQYFNFFLRLGDNPRAQRLHPDSNPGGERENAEAFTTVPHCPTRPGGHVVPLLGDHSSREKINIDQPSMGKP